MREGRPWEARDEYAEGPEEGGSVGGIEPLLTPVEVTRILRVSTGWVYRAARTGLIPSVQVGRNVRFRAVEIEEWVRNGGTSEDA